MHSGLVWIARLRRHLETSQRARGSSATIALVLGLIALAGLGLLIAQRGPGGAARGPDGRVAAPVEVAQIERGPIELRRTFSGSLEPRAQFDVAPKIGGRIERLAVDVGDAITRGAVVAELDNDEFLQAVALSNAELAVAKANVAEVESRAALSTRTLERVTALHARGVAADAHAQYVKCVTNFSEGYIAGAEVMFRPPRFSGSTSGIVIGQTPLGATYDDSQVVQPVGDWCLGGTAGCLSDDAYEIFFPWATPAEMVMTSGVRTTTSGTVNLPNPSIHLDGKIRRVELRKLEVDRALAHRQRD